MQSQNAPQSASTAKHATGQHAATAAPRASAPRLHHKTQQGFALVELGLALLVVAILVVAAVTLYTNNLRQTSISNNVTYIQNIASTAKANYGTRNQYGAVTTAVAVRSHIIPTTLRDGQAATATNPFGAAITTVSSNGTGTADLLTLTWGNVPASQCTEIVIGVSGSMRRITVGTTVVKALDANLIEDTLTTACEANTSDGNVAIVFDIGRS